MKAIKAAIVCALFANGMVADVNSPSSQLLASRLAELSKSGEAIVHKEYREDTQTVTRDKDGQFVVHVNTVKGEQNGDEQPVITRSQDEFRVPIDPSDVVYDEEWLNQMWDGMWDKQNTDWNPATAFQDEYGDKTVKDAEPVKVEPVDVQPLEQQQQPALDWRYPNEVDRILADTDDVVMPKLNSNYYDDADWYMNFQDYYDVMDFDAVSGEWKLNPVKFEQKYGIKPYDGTEDVLQEEIESLEQDIGEKQDEIEVEQDAVDELVDEALTIEAEKAKELTIEDIVSIDPVTGKMKIDKEGYYQMFGVYPSFEDEVEEEEEMEPVEPEQDDVFADITEGDQIEQKRWWNGYDGPNPYYPKDANKYWSGYQPRYQSDGYYQDQINGRFGPAVAA